MNEFKSGLIATVPMTSVLAAAIYFFGPAGAIGFIAVLVFVTATLAAGTLLEIERR